MKNSKKIMFIAMYLFCIMNTCCIAEGAEIEIVGSAHNTIRTSTVDISLEQYHVKDGKMIKGVSDSILLPGDTYSFVPVLTNNGVDSYVRLNIIFQNGISLLSVIDKELLIGLDDKWKVFGNYLYYTEVVSSGEILTVFDGIRIPTELSKKYEGITGTIVLTAEAVQKESFAVDFHNEQPWGDFQSEKNKDLQYDIDVLQKESPCGISVIYQGKGKQFVIAPEDFFAQFSSMLPGKTITDEIRVYNDSDESRELFLKIQPDDVVKHQSILSVLQLKVEMEEKENLILYEGDYLGENIKKGISLGLYNPQQELTIKFSIHMPKEMTNEYSLLNETSTWIFMTKDTEVLNISQEKGIVNQMFHTIASKTEDAYPVVLLTGIIAAMVVFLIITFRNKKKVDYEK